MLKKVVEDMSFMSLDETGREMVDGVKTWWITLVEDDIHEESVAPRDVF